MSFVLTDLGKALTPSDLAKILGCQTIFVRRHYIELGGIRLGPKKIVFFEKEIERAIQAQRRESEKALGWSDHGEREVQAGHVSHQEAGSSLGKRQCKVLSLVDSHGIFG